MLPNNFRAKSSGLSSLETNPTFEDGHGFASHAACCRALHMWSSAPRQACRQPSPWTRPRCRASACQWPDQPLPAEQGQAGGIRGSEGEGGSGAEGTTGVWAGGVGAEVTISRPGRCRGVVADWGRGAEAGGVGRAGAARGAAAGPTATSAACCLGAGEAAEAPLLGWISGDMWICLVGCRTVSVVVTLPSLRDAQNPGQA